MSIQYGGDKITFQDGSTVASGFTGFKNRIINGAMMIDQRNAGASVTVTTASSYGVDRWFGEGSVTSKFTAQRSTTAPTEFVNSLLLTSSAATTPGASDYYFIEQRVEGFNCFDLSFGSSSAKAITLSFWVQSSVTGTFSGAVLNAGTNRSYAFTYSISSANTWTQISVTIAGDTTGTWLTNNGIGLIVRFALGAGSSFLKSAGSWGTGNVVGATGTTNWISTSGATFYVTGVQLEKGSTATSFDYRPYGTELALCQRYYQMLDGYQGVGINSTNFYAMLAFQCPMRTTPSIGQTGVLAITDAVAADYTQSSTNIAINSSRVSLYSVNIQANNFSGMTAYRPYICKSGAGGYITLSAEL